jgi:RNA polymerase sigma-70 factor (ECF subfamily)
MNLTDQELAELYDRYGHVVYHRCLRILKDEEEARDAVHEVFARVIRHGARFRGEASPLTFMYRVATNHCLNQLRNRHGRANKLTVHREELAGSGHSGPPGADRQDLELVRAILDEVDEETRRCVVYTWFDDCTRQEVAELVGISVPTVRKRIEGFLHRARRRMGLPVALTTALLLTLAHAALRGTP